jgi:hypothetical protein
MANQDLIFPFSHPTLKVGPSFRLSKVIHSRFPSPRPESKTRSIIETPTSVFNFRSGFLTPRVLKKTKKVDQNAFFSKISRNPQTIPGNHRKSPGITRNHPESRENKNTLLIWFVGKIAGGRPKNFLIWIWIWTQLEHERTWTNTKKSTKSPKTTLLWGIGVIKF